MPLYRITPIHLDHPDWRTSTRVEPVVVRAPDEWTARMACQTAFGIAPVKRPGAPTPMMAWPQPGLTICTKVPPSELWPADGPTEILDPELEHPALVEEIAKIDV